MAVEPKRGCGHRKQGGLYLVSGGKMVACDRLPMEMTVCSCCGAGIKQARGWTWIEPYNLFEGDHDPEIFFSDDEEPRYYNKCTCSMACPVCFPANNFKREDDDGSWVFDGKAGLIWIGEKHYKTPYDFQKEGAEMGISRRINSIPKGFEIGKTWVFLAHPKAIMKMEPKDPAEESTIVEEEEVFYPAIFTAYRPTKIEKLVKQSDYDVWAVISDVIAKCDFGPDLTIDDFREDAIETHKKLQRDIDRGITLVPVPDDDPDHKA